MLQNIAITLVLFRLVTVATTIEPRVTGSSPVGGANSQARGLKGSIGWPVPRKHDYLVRSHSDDDPCSMSSGGRVVVLAEEQWGLSRANRRIRGSFNTDLVGEAAVMTTEPETAPALARIGLVELD